jgi:hypothetical protein
MLLALWMVNIVLLHQYLLFKWHEHAHFLGSSKHDKKSEPAWYVFVRTWQARSFKKEQGWKRVEKATAMPLHGAFVPRHG